MKCPECGMVGGVQDRICGRCHYCPELQAPVALEPPRAGWGRRWEQVGVGARRRLARVPTETATNGQKATRLGIMMVASVVPGLGHLFRGRWKTGLAFMSVVILGVTFASTTANATAGQLVLGLSLSVHVMSIMTLIPKSFEMTTGTRIAASLGIMLALGGTFYMPWSRTLMADWGEYAMVDVRRVNETTWIANFLTSATATLVFIVVAVVAWMVSRAISGLIQRRRDRAQ